MEPSTTNIVICRANEYMLSAGIPLAQGSYDTIVILCQDCKSKSIFVAKYVFTPNPSMLNDYYKYLRELFNHEAFVLKKIKNDMIVKIKDYGPGILYNKFDKEDKYADSNLWFIESVITEFDSNCRQTLYDLIHNNTNLSVDMKLNLFKNILIAESELIKIGILHCDLKLCNILVYSDCQSIKLIDFGAAIIGSNTSPMILRKDMRNTVYRAPEILNNQFNYSESSEVFALGVIMFQLLFGKDPFFLAEPGDSFYACIFKRNFDELLMKHEIGANSIANATKELLMSMLQYNPTDRPSVAEILSHFQ